MTPTAHAAAVDALLQRTLVETAAVFAVAAVVLVVLVARALRRAEARPGGDGPRARAATLALAAGLFVLVDAPLLRDSDALLRHGAWDFRVPREDPSTVRVEVVARQWAWELRLAGPDGAFATRDDVVGFGEIAVPRGAPVHVQVESRDVVHSFSLPAARLMADVVPGRRSQLWFRTESPGALTVACAQHCGPGHPRMTGTVRVLEREDWEAWLAHAGAAASRAASVPGAPPPGGWPWTELP